MTDRCAVPQQGEGRNRHPAQRLQGCLIHAEDLLHTHAIGPNTWMFCEADGFDRLKYLIDTL